MFAPEGNDKRRLHGLFRNAAIGGLCAVAVMIPQSAFAARTAPALTFTQLKLINGWHNVGFGAPTAKVAEISGIVQFKGWIKTSGSNDEPFVLPPAFRPATQVFVPVNLSGPNNGRLLIEPSGVVHVQAEGGTFSHAQAGTMLDGASFAKSASGFTALKLINGWTNGPFSTSKAEARVISGIVHFKGAIKTSGNNPVPFVLPPAFRPDTTVYLPVDLCGANHGRLIIGRSGKASVAAEGGTFSNAKCFTSLDGASFARSGHSFTALTPQNGWHNYGFGTARPAARVISGVVHVRGAIATSGTNNEPFVLPPGFRPAATIQIQVDLCNANDGDLTIERNGAVFVNAEIRFSDLQCFTSLDGVAFAR
jgi:hypothetical protein